MKLSPITNNALAHSPMNFDSMPLALRLYSIVSYPAYQSKRASVTGCPLVYTLFVEDYSAEERTLPSLMRLAITSSAMDLGTASYCLKIIVKVPRPCVTVRMAFE